MLTALALSKPPRPLQSGRHALRQLAFGPKAHPDSDDDHRMTEPSPAWQLQDGTWARHYRDAGSIHADSHRTLERSSDRKAAATTWRFHLPTEKSRPYHVARISQIPARGPMPEDYPIVRTMWLTTSCPCHPKGRSRTAGHLLVRKWSHLRSKSRTAVRRAITSLRRASDLPIHTRSLWATFLWFIYSVNKEDIEVAQILLAELRAGRLARRKALSR